MFRITRDPSSGSSIQCLAKITVCRVRWYGRSRCYGSIFARGACVCTAQAREVLTRLCSTHMHHGQICLHNTDYVHIHGHDRTITVILAKHFIELPDDGSIVIRNMLEQF